MTGDFAEFPSAEEYRKEMERLKDDNKDFFTRFTTEELVVMKQNSQLE